MVQEIHYGGMTANTDARSCPDGDLDLAVNLVNEDGSLRPAMPPKVVVNLPDGCEVLYIHKGAKYSHAIVSYLHSYWWFDMPSESDLGGDPLDIVYSGSATDNIHDLKDGDDPCPLAGVEVYQFTSVGNTLVALTADGQHFYLWQDNAYDYLGTEIPEVSMRFSLKGHIVSDLTGHTVKWCDDDTSNEKNYAPVTFEGDEANLTGHFVQARDFSQTASDTLGESLYALVNSFVAEHSTNKGRFMYPFLIRYALRLYDGTIVHHSSPVLMVCCTGTMPHVFFNYTDLYESSTSEYVGYMRWGPHDDKTYIAGLTHDLYYMCDAANIATLIDKWSDIVKSLDIFISAPIYTYNPNGRFKRIKSILYQDGIDGYSLSQWGTQGDFNGEWHDTFQGIYTEQLHSVFSLYGASPETKLLEQTRMRGEGRVLPVITSFSNGQLKDMRVGGYTIPLPEKSQEDMDNEIKSVANFYLLKSYDIDELKTVGSSDGAGGTVSRVKIDIADDYLESLTAREQMTDDYNSHDTLIPRSALSYNSRLNLYELSKKLFSGFRGDTYFHFTEGYFPDSCLVPAYDYNSDGYVKIQNPAYNYTDYWNWISNDLTVNGRDTKAAYNVRVYVRVKRDGREVWLRGNGGSCSFYLLGNNYMPIYLFYPDSDADQALIELYDGDTILYTCEVKLTTHEFLTGAVYFSGLPGHTNVVGVSENITLASGDDLIFDLSGKVYTSDVDNPWVYRATNINTIGTGKVLALATAARPLSEGQFGQFPLYAFTDEGVWAMSVTDQGGYSAVQPITRDVIIDKASLVSLDQTVLFASARGIMEIAGSQAACVSDAVNTRYPFDLTTLPRLSAAVPSDFIAGLQPIPFPDFIKACTIAYDYRRQRVYFYNTSVGYAYVLALKSGLWSLTTHNSQLTTPLNSYPDALVQVDNSIVAVDRDGADNADTLLVTRPLKLSAPDILKTVDTAITRGVFARGELASAIYASRDLLNWLPVNSSVDQYLRGRRGTPFHYFRLVNLGNLTPDRRITGASVDIYPRRQNHLR